MLSSSLGSAPGATLSSSDLHPDPTRVPVPPGFAGLLSGSPGAGQESLNSNAIRELVGAMMRAGIGRPPEDSMLVDSKNSALWGALAGGPDDRATTNTQIGMM